MECFHNEFESVKNVGSRFFMALEILRQLDDEAVMSNYKRWIFEEHTGRVIPLVSMAR